MKTLKKYIEIQFTEKLDKLLNIRIYSNDHAKIKQASDIKQTSVSEFILKTALFHAEAIINSTL